MTKSSVEKVKLRIGTVAKTFLITGEVDQHPKDALNEFVSNAAERVRRGRADAESSDRAAVAGRP